MRTLLEVQGKCRNTMKKMVIPKDQISVWKVYFYWRSIWGDINWKVPENVTVYLSKLCSLIILATPKSDILIFPSCNKIFLGLMSLWIIFSSFIYFKASAIYAIYFFNTELGSPYSWITTSSSSVPPSQNSKNK